MVNAQNECTKRRNHFSTENLKTLFLQVALKSPTKKSTD